MSTDLNLSDTHRIQCLLNYEILDTPQEPEFDRLTQTAAEFFDVPTVLISLLDKERQWFKSKVGLDVDETPKSISFCQYTILEQKIFQVENALEDDFFKQHPLVVNKPNIRFYAGYPIINHEGYALGTFCLIDSQPRKLSAKEEKLLIHFAQQTAALIENRKKLKNTSDFEHLFDMTLDLIAIAGTDAYFKKINPAFSKILGWSEDEFLSKPFLDFVHPDDLESTLKEVEKLSEGKNTVNFTNRYHCKNGSYKTLQWVAAVDTDRQLIYAIARDISQSLEMQGKIADQKHLMDTMSQQAKIGVWEVNLEQNFVYWSKMTRDIHEVQDDFVPDLATGINFYKEGESRETISRLVQQAMTTGESYSTQLQIITAKGNEKWVEAHGTSEFKNGKCVRMMGSFQDITDKKRADDIKNFVSCINQKSIDSNKDLTFFNELLEGLLKLTESEYGFIGEVFFDDGKPYLITQALTNIAWDKATRDLFEKHHRLGLEFRNLDTLFGRALVEEKPIISNNPKTDPRAGGIPKGHPDLNAFMGIPIFTEHQELIGMIGVANKKKGYTEEDIDYIKPLLSSYSSIIQSIRLDRKRVKAEKLLEVNESRLLEAQSIAKIGNWEYHFQEKFTYWSAEHYDIFEIEPSLLGEELEKAFRQSVHPDDLKEMDEFAKHVKIDKTGFEYEYRIILPNGSVKTVKAIGKPLYDEHEKLIGIKGTVQDITLQKKSLQEVLQLKNALDETAIVAITDAKGKIEYANKKFCEISEYELTELIGKDHHILNSGHHPKSFFKELWRTIGSGNVWKGEIKNRTKNGNYYWVATTIVPFLDSKGKPIQYVSIRQDITAIKELEENLRKSKIQAEESLKAKEEFLTNMSHEIRTPLNSILGYSELLTDSPLSPEQQEFVSTLQMSGENLLFIINDILDFSKIDSGELQIENIPIDLNALLKNLIKIIKPKAQNQQLILDFNLNWDKPLYIKGDPVRINQILLNLLNNAVKFTPEGFIELNGIIQKETDQMVDVLFEIRDTGIGIPEDRKAFIFNRFTQASSDTTRKFGGTGLGLSICQSLIEMMDGSISFESIEGAGSTFKVQLSFEKSTEKEIGQTDCKEKLNIENPSQLHVLLVEDNEVNSRLAITIFNKMGISIEWATNGEEAIEFLQNNTYDLIFMDLQMPIMDGYTATQIIRNELNNPTPIIAMTAHSLRGEKEKCLALGMTDYLAKPFKQKELVEKIITHSQKKAIPMEMELNDQHFDFEFLKECFADDHESLIEILDLFIKKAPTVIDELQQTIQLKDYEEIGKAAHLLKSTFSSVSPEFQEDLGELEIMAHEKKPKAKISKKLTEVLPHLQAIINYTQKEINSLKI